jgi:hypothetical protein
MQIFALPRTTKDAQLPVAIDSNLDIIHGETLGEFAVCYQLLLPHSNRWWFLHWHNLKPSAAIVFSPWIQSLEGYPVKLFLCKRWRQLICCLGQWRKWREGIFVCSGSCSQQETFPGNIGHRPGNHWSCLCWSHTIHRVRATHWIQQIYSRVVGEILVCLSDWRLCNFFLKQILLVQIQNHRSVGEPTTITDLQ